MKIFPAIDLIAGKAVRLTQGDYKRVDIFKRRSLGCREGVFMKRRRGFLHVVDLDGAKQGTLANFDTIKRIVEAAPLFVEVGGGIRDEGAHRKGFVARCEAAILRHGGG